jgi:hypothetical protein
MMVIKRLFLFSLAAFFSAAALTGQESGGSAPKDPAHWHIGVAGGYTRNQLYTSEGAHVFTAYDAGDGFAISIPVRYQFNSWFALQTELQYIQKNYSWRRTEQYTGLSSEITNSFISVPLMANFSVGGSRLRGFLNAGGYLGVWVESRRKGTWQGFADNVDPDKVVYFDFDEKVDFNKDRDNQFDAGLLLGIGLQYAFNPCAVFLEGRFNYGLTDLQKDYMYDKAPRINDTFVFTAGVVFNSAIFNTFKKGK